MSDKELKNKVWDIVRYNKFNLSDSEAVNEIMSLIESARKEAWIAGVNTGHDAEAEYQTRLRAELNTPVQGGQ